MWELIWPSRCAGCGVDGAGLLCARCQPAVVHRPPLQLVGITEVLTCAGYGSGAGRALRRAKYTPLRLLLGPLAQGFAAAVAPLVRGRIRWIVPAPSPWSTRVRRGFDAAAFLADRLSRQTSAPVVYALTARAGPRQASLTAEARRKSAGARIRGDTPLQGRVLLVDDVVTTGATAEACARELLGSGADEVWLATLCATRRRTAVSQLSQIL